MSDTTNADNVDRLVDDLNNVARFVDDYEEIELDEQTSRTLGKLKEKLPDVPEEEIFERAIGRQLNRELGKLNSDQARREWLGNQVAQSEAELAYHRRMLNAVDACMGELVEIAARDVPSPAVAMAWLMDARDPDEVDRVLAQAKRRGFLWPTPSS